MKRVFDFIYNVKLEYFIASAFTLLMITTMFMNVILRYVFNFAFGWSDEIVRYLNLFAAFFAISAGMKHGTHIGITAFVDLAVPKAAKKYARLLAELVTLIFCLVIVYYGFSFVSMQFKMNQISPALRVPMYIMYACVPVGMLLTTFQCIFKTFYRKEWKTNLP